MYVWFFVRDCVRDVRACVYVCVCVCVCVCVREREREREREYVCIAKIRSQRLSVGVRVNVYPSCQYESQT